MLDRTIAPKLKKVQNFKLLKPQGKKLKNGLQLHIINSGSQPLLNLQMVFKAGKWFEQSSGIAFFTAKMLLEGTSNLNSSQISYSFDKYGASYDIHAGNDYLTIDVYFLSKFLKPILSLINDLITDSCFPEKELDRIKNIAKQNLKINNQKNKYLSNIYLKNKLFGDDHPYGYSFSEELINSISSEHLIQYFESNIKNKPFDIFIAGEVKPNYLDDIDLVIGNLNIGNKGQIIENNKAVRSDYSQLYQDKANSIQTAIMVGKNIFKYGHPDQLVFGLLNKILGGYFGSRLMQNIREEKALSYGIGSGVTSFQNESFFFISTEVKKANWEEVMSEVYKEIELLKKEPVSDKELETLKNYVTGSHIKSINTPISLLNYYKTIYYHDLPETHFDDFISKVYNVTPNEIQAMANKYFSGDFVEVAVG